METSQQMALYRETADCNMSPLVFLGGMVTLLAVSLLQKNTTLHSNVERLEDEIEMAHMHQEVLEKDIHDLEYALQQRGGEPRELQSEIIGILNHNKKGMQAKELHNALVGLMPHITKKDVNSMLYKMSNKKMLTKKVVPSENAPLWLMA
jgi:exoribonuclease II